MKNILLLLLFCNLFIVHGKAQCGSCPVSYSATPSIGTYQTASTNVTFPCQSIEYKAGYFKFKINATPTVSNGSTTLSFVLEKITKNKNGPAFIFLGGRVHTIPKTSFSDDERFLEICWRFGASFCDCK